VGKRFRPHFVKAFTDDVPEGLAGREPLSTCATEIDPRRPLWKCALEAVRALGLRFPHEVPRCPLVVLLVVERHTAGVTSVETEARVVCDVHATDVSIAVAIDGELPMAIRVRTPGRRPSVADVANAAFAALAKA
jgi:hypothetical protein